jgi:L-asparagine transporter-like permease
MISLLFTLLIVGVVIGLVYWVVDFLPVPEPFNKIIKVVAVVVFVIVVIYILMGLIGHAPDIKLP